MTDFPLQTDNRFIPARESVWFSRLFGWYTKWLFRIRFKRVWIKQNYFPGPDSKTIYYLNHSSWWDGITPLLLNRYLLRQRARAMMEYRQMTRFRFFTWLGAFSVQPDDTQAKIRSLRYALDSMAREGASLFIYPEGKMVPFSTDKPDFQKGLSWLSLQLPDVDVVPVGIYIHTMRHNKPEMHIQIGESVDTSGYPGHADHLGELMERSLQKQLKELQKKGGFDDSYFVKWL